MDFVHEKLQKLVMTEREAPTTYLGRMCYSLMLLETADDLTSVLGIIEEVQDQEEVICFKGPKTMQ